MSRSARLLSLLCFLLPATARAQITQEPVAPLPDPRKFARGIFVDAEAGATVFLGRARKPLGTGFAVGLRLGYDLMRFVALQAHFVGSSHHTDFRGAPQSDQLIQLYLAKAELKLSIPIGRVSVFAFGGAGLAHLSTNLLSTTDLVKAGAGQTMLAYGAGGGVDYHTLSRHFSFGLQGAYDRLDKLRGPGAVAITSYLRYTF